MSTDTNNDTDDRTPPAPPMNLPTMNLPTANLPITSRSNRLQLERLALGQLSPEQELELINRYGREQVEEAREQLELENKSLLLDHPPERIVPRIEQRIAIAKDERRLQKRQARMERRIVWTTPAIALAAIFIAVSVGGLQSDDPQDDGSIIGDIISGGIASEESTRIKGLDPVIHLYRARLGGAGGAEDVVPLGDGDYVFQGDVVQMSYVSAGREYGVIISVDGTGAVSLHAPDNPNDLLRLNDDGEVRLDFALELDDAPGFERFFLVTANEPISPERVIESALRLAADPDAAMEQPLSLPDDWEQTALTLLKDNR